MLESCGLVQPLAANVAIVKAAALFARQRYQTFEGELKLLPSSVLPTAQPRLFSLAGSANLHRLEANAAVLR